MERGRKEKTASSLGSIDIVDDNNGAVRVRRADGVDFEFVDPFDRAGRNVVGLYSRDVDADGRKGHGGQKRRVGRRFDLISVQFLVTLVTSTTRLSLLPSVIMVAIDPITVYSLLAVLCLLVIAYVASLTILPRSAPRADKLTFCWYTFDALTHFILEGSFVYLSTFGRSVATSENAFAELCELTRNYTGTFVRRIKLPTLVAFEVVLTRPTLFFSSITQGRSTAKPTLAGFTPIRP